MLVVLKITEEYGSFITKLSSNVTFPGGWMTTLYSAETFNMCPSGNVITCSTASVSWGAMKVESFKNRMLCVGKSR